MMPFFSSRVNLSIRVILAKKTNGDIDKALAYMVRKLLWGPGSLFAVLGAMDLVFPENDLLSWTSGFILGGAYLIVIQGSFLESLYMFGVGVLSFVTMQDGGMDGFSLATAASIGFVAYIAHVHAMLIRADRMGLSLRPQADGSPSKKEKDE